MFIDRKTRKSLSRQALFWLTVLFFLPTYSRTSPQLCKFLFYSKMDGLKISKGLSKNKSERPHVGSFTYFPTEMNKGFGERFFDIFKSILIEKYQVLNKRAYLTLFSNGEARDTDLVYKGKGIYNPPKAYRDALEEISSQPEFIAMSREVYNNALEQWGVLQTLFPKEKIELDQVELRFENKTEAEGVHKDIYPHEYFVTTQTLFAVDSNGNSLKLAGTRYKDDVSGFMKKERLVDYVVPTSDLGIHSGVARQWFYNSDSPFSPKHTGFHENVLYRVTVIVRFKKRPLSFRAQ